MTKQRQQPAETVATGGDKFRAGLVQLRSGREVGANLDRAEALVRKAAAAGALYVQTPENTPLMELNSKRLFSVTHHEADEPALPRFASLASELKIWLHVGSIAVKLAEDRMANRSFVFAPDGSRAASYDKIHMFDVDLPGGESYRESKNYAPGREAVLCELPWGRLGLTTCYDLRFAALYRALAQSGANFISVPSAFTRQTGEAHWHVLLRARAIETGCYIFAAAQGGRHENGRETYGHSMIVSPWGEIVAEAGADPGIIVADIDPSQSAVARARIPSLKHDRDFALRDGKAAGKIRVAS